MQHMACVSVSTHWYMTWNKGFIVEQLLTRLNEPTARKALLAVFVVAGWLHKFLISEPKAGRRITEPNAKLHTYNARHSTYE